MPFDQKKTSYFGTGSSSAYVLTTKVLAEASWTPDVLEARQANLLSVLARAWNLDLKLWHSGTGTTTKPGQLDDSVLSYLARATPHTRSLFERINERLLALDGVERTDQKSRISYDSKQDSQSVRVADVKVQPATETVVVYLTMDPTEVNLRDGFTRDVTAIGHHSPGNLEVRVRSDEDLRDFSNILYHFV